MKNNFFQKSFVSTNNLTRSDIDKVFKKAKQMERVKGSKKATDRLKGKILAALFYEPSSRTFSSFISAMQLLGGGIIPISGMQNTSVAKGETLTDTVRVFSHYADVIVIRHGEPGSVEKAADKASKPVINAGDGVNEHPTQALIDLYTIWQKFGKVDNLHLLLIGDLAHYRPTNSLMKLLALFKNVKLSLATPKEVPIQDNLRKYLKQKKVDFTEYTTFDHLLKDIDVLYVTRVKKEYMSKQMYNRVKGSYQVNKKTLEKMRKNSIIMHCLPRIDEINTDIDDDKRSLYFGKQVENGLYIRMALLDLIMNKE